MYKRKKLSTDERCKAVAKRTGERCRRPAVRKGLCPSHFKSTFGDITGTYLKVSGGVLTTITVVEKIIEYLSMLSSATAGSSSGVADKIAESVRDGDFEMASEVLRHLANSLPRNHHAKRRLTKLAITYRNNVRRYEQVDSEARKKIGAAIMNEV
ncbi:MAG: hypothetical protein ABJ370_11665 [Paracoccaceae bacterium]